MSAWLNIVPLIGYIISTYYFFLAYPVKKAVLFVFTSTTFFASCLLAFPRTDTSLRENIANDFYLHSGVPLKTVGGNPENLNVIQIKNATLSNIRTRQWNEGNSLYVFNGEIKNNSSYPINSLNLELRLLDCGPKDNKTKCIPVEDSIYAEVSKLDIQPHKAGQFESSYAIEHPDHHYEIEVYFMSAISSDKNTPTPSPQIAHKKIDLEKNQHAAENRNVDRMPICGGGADVDEPEIQRPSGGRIMLAEALENYQRRDRGC